ncbi:sulfotransferase domain-containing protein [Tahibacter amnicola]|uniref:Sulfotransferase domain-containing protein n=1 Tax=Tahibacter amnicola TaxID=2976241 RepID=A0ABY6BE14_9GAMM|nr:sulfotransferase domain-containing protein [Tahibacter amnicola]UXI67831.1 sulfotransferase domain-containing protein [Tahibacter amnicola]
MFDTRTQFHEYPDVEGFARYDVEIASSEMPSGASWLANCLLELDVALWKPWGADLREDWQSLGERRFRYVRSDEAWRRLLPSLEAGREFQFRATPVPRMTHAWPGTYGPVARTILFVRDPRDALHSLWHRARRIKLVPADESFERFLADPWFHYPVSRADYLAFWLRVWRVALAGREHLIVRYEDYRRDALGTLQRATAFLGLTATPAQLQAAVAASDYQVAREAEARLIDAGTVDAVFNRAGCAEEWRRAFDPDMHRAVGSRFAALYDWLGYAPDASGQARPGKVVDPAWIDSMLVAAQADQWPDDQRARLRCYFTAACTGP